MAQIAHVPTITSAAHTHTVYQGLGNGGTGGLGLVQMDTTAGDSNWQNMMAQTRRHNALGELSGKANLQQVKENIKKDIEMAVSNKRRLVKVIIVDTDENVPLEKCVLYSGDEKMTDATDQELFFEIEIKNILDEYNKYRVTVKDKSIKDRTEYLEPVKIRDLRMVVVNVATF